MSKKGSVWILSVDNSDMLNAIAVFETLQDANEFVKSKGLEPLQKILNEENIYSTTVSMGEDTKQTLFECYFRENNDHFGTYTLWLHERRLGEQFLFAQNE
jgi:H2-forming N5,N10-methylenetetrahydromethanopterin dehydrogenase-like enzyme